MLPRARDLEEDEGFLEDEVVDPRVRELERLVDGFFRRDSSVAVSRWEGTDELLCPFELFDRVVSLCSELEGHDEWP